MSFECSFPTRHTDTYAASGFVHAGVLLALTELAYAAFELHCGIEKPAGVLAVPRETAVTYHRPLPWQDGCRVAVETTEVGERGFSQEFTCVSDDSGIRIATFRHDWVWLDLRTGRSVAIPPEVQEKYRRG
jgi:acyl-CoA thioesterase FadM